MTLVLRTSKAALVERERAIVARAAEEAPRDADAFVEWFRALAESGGRDPLFPFLAERASLFELRWYLNQELAGDEASRLRGLAKVLGVDGAGAVAEVRALRKLVGALDTDARYVFQAAGAAAAMDVTGEARAASVRRGIQRLGIDGDFFEPALEAWSGNSIREFVQAMPRCATALAEGALMRLRAGARCYARYRRELGFVEPIVRRVTLLASLS